MSTSPIDRALTLTATLLLGSAALHLLVWWLDGSAWEGPASFRKPVLFGFSVGVTALSMRWVTGALEPTPGLRASVLAWAGLMVAEVALITLQAWRRRPSHFNTETTLDFAIFFAMGALIIAAWLVTLGWTWQLACLPHQALPTRLAMLGGLGLFHLGCALGVFMSVRGTVMVSEGATHTELMGPAGSVHLAHAIALHALQALPVLGWLLERRGATMASSVLAVAGAVGALAALFAWSLIQMAQGRAPREVWHLDSLALLALAVALTLPSVFALAKPAAAALFTPWRIT